METEVRRIDPIREAGLETEVREMIINRWPATRIFKHLRDQCGVAAPLSMIAEHIAAIPESEKLPEAGLDKRYRSEVRMDPLQEMQRLLREQSSRVEAALAIEDVVSGSGADKKLAAVVGQEITTYFKMLREFVETAQSLGILQKQPEEIMATLRSHQPTLGELRRRRDAGVGQLLEPKEEQQRPESVLPIGPPNDEDVGAGAGEDSRTRVGGRELGTATTEEVSQSQLALV